MKQVTPIPRVRVIEHMIARNKPIKQKIKKKTIHSVFVLRNSATSFSNSFTFSTSTMLMSSSVYHSILHCDSTLIRSCSSSVFVLKFVVSEVKRRSTVNPSRSSTLLILLSKRSCWAKVVSIRPVSCDCFGASETGGSSCDSFDGCGTESSVLSPVNMIECRTIRTLSLIDRQRMMIESTISFEVSVYSPAYSWMGVPSISTVSSTAE